MEYVKQQTARSSVSLQHNPITETRSKCCEAPLDSFDQIDAEIGSYKTETLPLQLLIYFLLRFKNVFNSLSQEVLTIINHTQ